MIDNYYNEGSYWEGPVYVSWEIKGLWETVEEKTYECR
jgi:hypothetical protein